MTQYIVKVFPNAAELQNYLTNNCSSSTIDGLAGWDGLVLVYH